MRPDALADVLAGKIKTLLGPVIAQAAVQDTTIAALTARVVALEGRAPEPGPPGPPGPAGRDGVDGKAGSFADSFTGRYVAGKAYARGDLVTEDGSTFIRLESDDAPGRPGKSAGWQIVAMRGNQGRDGGKA
jgi:hypothetical protein